VKQWEVYPEFYHALFQETGRERVMARTGEFLRQCFAERPERAHLLNADMGGPMRTECDLLRAPENGMGKMSWPAVRSGIRLASAFSEGLRLGREAGFDSGIMLDYVYRNKADGITPLGRVIDSFYLNSIGWRGIRVRRQNSQRLLRRAIESFPADVPLHILDVAAGAGRYLLQTMQHFPGRTITAHLRDYQEANLAAAGKLAAERRLTGVTRQCADAFDAESILALKVPQIAIASGIFELMEMNAPVARCLGALSRLMGKGSVLIYTNQPWHPQLEFIARGLTNHRGKPWLMRRRSQAEMDELVRAAGFEKAEQAIDPYGIFTVALARKG
jgi:SAM-dependent methyltransferase